MKRSTPAATTPSPTTLKGTVPATWPGAFGLLKYSKQAVLVNLWPLIGLTALYIATSVAFHNFNGYKPDPTAIGRGDILNSLVGILLVTAGIQLLLAGVHKTKMSVTEALGLSLPLYLKAFLLDLLTGLIAVLSFLLFIVPFFIVMPRLELAMYFLVDKNMGPIESLNASWTVTKGNVSKLWAIYALTLLMAVAVILLVGIYFLFIYSAAFAVLYVHLTSRQATTTPTPNEAAAVPPATTE
jgi:hypothetical protein